MATELSSLRIDKETVERLAARSRETGEAKSCLAQRYIEEGLRMDAHPGILFQDGPTGQRARLLVGPDIWEVVSIMGWFDGTRDEVIRETRAVTGLTARWMEVVLRYYAEYPDEIDERVRRNLEASERAYAEQHPNEPMLRR